MVTFDILRSTNGVDFLPTVAEHAIRNPGILTLNQGRRAPFWVPPGQGYAYLARDGELYEAGSDDDAPPRRVGNLTEAVFGTALLTRVAANARGAFVFTTREPQVLAQCLEDDTQVSLSAKKAESLIRAGEPVTVTRDVLDYAVIAAVRAVGGYNAAQAARNPQGDEPWTLRRIFGTIR